jgi:hypothetical protein
MQDEIYLQSDIYHQKVNLVSPDTLQSSLLLFTGIEVA